MVQNVEPNLPAARTGVNAVADPFSGRQRQPPTKKWTARMSQGSLFDTIPASSGTAGLAGVMPAVRAIMNRVAGEYPAGRKMLVDALAETARREGIPLTSGGGKVIKEDQLDKILQHGDRGHEPTLGFILCFCFTTKNYAALEPIWKPFGLVLIPAKDLRWLEYGKSCDVLKKAKDTKRKLEARL
jgi:hypothetical protein